MAKILTEFVSLQDLDIIKEDVGSDQEKSLKIKGIFLKADTKNKNGRTYPKSLMDREVNLYQDKIKRNQSIGSLDHTSDAFVKLSLASHIITELDFVNDVDVVGVARIISTPLGKIARTLVQEGVILGVSSRSCGTLSKVETESQGKLVENFKLIAIDIVADPSTPGAFVESIMESKEYIIDGDKIMEQAFDNLQNNLDNKYKHSKQLLSFMNEFLDSMGKNLK
jgi:hypothetical protein